MNILALVPFILLGIGLFWALWLIFKRDFLSQNLGKVVTYFIGVVITFWVILWLVGQFLPWWTSELLENTRGSEEVQSIQNIGQQIWEDATGPGADTAEPTVYVPPQTTPETNQPAPTTEGDSGGISSQGVTAGERTHTVQAGDTLFGLSKRYGVTLDALKQRNGLTSDMISIGQTLIIP